jgi:hypothetical protein
VDGRWEGNDGWCVRLEKLKGTLLFSFFLPLLRGRSWSVLLEGWCLGEAYVGLERWRGMSSRVWCETLMVRDGGNTWSGGPDVRKQFTISAPPTAMVIFKIPC